MGETISCPYCGSGQIKERVAIRYEDYDKRYNLYRCLECGREFSEKDLENTRLPYLTTIYPLQPIFDIEG